MRHRLAQRQELVARVVTDGEHCVRAARFGEAVQAQVRLCTRRERQGHLERAPRLRLHGRGRIDAVAADVPVGGVHDQQSVHHGG